MPPILDMSGFYTFQFDSNGLNVNVKFYGSKPLTLDQIESLAKCDSLSRRTWALNLIDKYPNGTNEFIQLCNRTDCTQTLFDQYLLEEQWTEGLFQHTHTDNKITLTIYRLFW